MVAVDEPLVRAPWEAAALVAGVQCAAKWGGDRARLAANVQWIAILGLNDGNDARIACHATARFRGNAGTVLDLAAA